MDFRPSRHLHEVVYTWLCESVTKTGILLRVCDEGEQNVTSHRDPDLCAEFGNRLLCSQPVTCRCPVHTSVNRHTDTHTSNTDSQHGHGLTFLTFHSETVYKLAACRRTSGKSIRQLKHYIHKYLYDRAPAKWLSM